MKIIRKKSLDFCYMPGFGYRVSLLGGSDKLGKNNLGSGSYKMTWTWVSAEYFFKAEIATIRKVSKHIKELQ